MIATRLILIHYTASGSDGGLFNREEREGEKQSTDWWWVLSSGFRICCVTARIVILGCVILPQNGRWYVCGRRRTQQVC